MALRSSFEEKIKWNIDFSTKMSTEQYVYLIKSFAGNIKFKWELEIEALLLNHIGMQGIPKEKDSSRELFIEAICCFYNWKDLLL